MIQSALQQRPSDLHVAVIMDGNGRWAEARGKPRSAGHRVGARTARAIVEAAPGYGIGTLTLFAFSSDNWRRPPEEVRALMRLYRGYLRAEAEACAREGVRLKVIGRRDRLRPVLVEAIEAAEEKTRAGRALVLRIALDYSARDAILAAVAHVSPHTTREELSHALGEVNHDSGPAPDVDLLIRTGGERRLSDFLLWECAYAELYFSDLMWPDFGPVQLEAAVADYRSRERRFGRVSQQLRERARAGSAAPTEPLEIVASLPRRGRIRERKPA